MEGAPHGRRRRRGFVLVALRELRGSRPMVDHGLYRGNRLFVAACAAALLVYAGSSPPAC